MVNRSLAFTVIFICMLTGLYVLGFLFPGALTWGFHVFGFLPRYFLYFYVLFIIACTLHFLREDINNILTRISDFMADVPYKFLGITIITFIITAILFRVKVPLLGDGFFLVKNISEALRNTAPLYYRNEPLATFYYFNMMDLFGVSTFKEFLQTFLMADLFVGIGFIIIVFLIVRNLFSDNQHQFLAFIYLLTPAYIQLFFGYVEIYAAILFIVAVYTLTAVIYLKKKIPFPYVAVVFLVMTLCHYLSLALLPSLLYLAYHEHRSRGIRGLVLGFGAAAIIFVGLLALVNFDVDKFSSSVPHSHFLPVFNLNNPAEAYSTAYTLFSGYHLLDLLNFLVLMCPFSILLLLLSLGKNKATFTKSVEYKFFVAAIIPLIILLCTIKFDLGAAKDWDVLAPFVFIVVLFSIYVFLRAKITEMSGILSLVIIFSFLNGLSFISLNSTSEASIQRYQTLLDKRTVGNFGFYGATLHLALYYHQTNNKPAAVDSWEKYSQAFPSDPRGYRNIVTNLRYLGLGGFVRTSETYGRWLSTNPNDTNATVEYSHFCLDAGNYFSGNSNQRQAKIYFEKAVILDSTFDRAYNNLGSIYANEGNLEKAIELFKKAIKLNSAYPDPLFNMGSIYEKQSNKKSYEYYEQAARLGNAPAQEKLKQLNNIK